MTALGYIGLAAIVAPWALCFLGALAGWLSGRTAFARRIGEDARWHG